MFSLTKLCTSFPIHTPILCFDSETELFMDKVLKIVQPVKQQLTSGSRYGLLMSLLVGSVIACVYRLWQRLNCRHIYVMVKGHKWPLLSVNTLTDKMWLLAYLMPKYLCPNTYGVIYHDSPQASLILAIQMQSKNHPQWLEANFIICLQTEKKATKSFRPIVATPWALGLIYT